ncbi:polysaccharide pyruvyl transferase family protein [Phormidium tenue]|uniref:Polysaccharide pyruvyl transferase domain-containing protein n=1 Tax=Phormidium tenue NIES-30 TaxID=549789 RepID=A0A1U7JBD3_9CYAN|nr:polysaccharide pyruvyl transferase family protein [Phormidium tenue]MBD2230084.1 polysaccharide pyruvyl transferase family protein [Phormidium tenue FACHB-1052]OKH51077.1 hypothetical protein NIES30_03140 [Phormidium tenue NIES-30]
MITVLDPGLENNRCTPSSNLGDLIIQESVKRELRNIFPISEIFSLSTQDFIEPEKIKFVRNSSHVFVGGTNLLSSKMRDYKQWKISFIDAIQIQKAVLFGVGWWQYQDKPDLYTSLLLKTALSSKYIHSVRDGYTQRKLEEIGFRNVVNTSCPTMWPLATVKPESFPVKKSENVLLTLTDYNKNPSLDKKLISLLTQKYKTVYFWPQGRGDLDYFSHLGFSVKILEHSFEALKVFLSSTLNFDYIGTRLHGGIYCLCASRRSLIIEIDNRSKELSEDTSLPTVKRNDLEYIEHWIESSFEFKVTLDLDAIKLWKSQFLRL